MREMREGENMLARIAAMQDHKAYQEQHWEGTLRGLPRDRPREPRGHAHRLPAHLRHDPLAREDRVHRQQEEAHPLPLLPRREVRRQGRHLRPRRPADEAGQRLQERRPGLRHRAARAPAARPGRLVARPPSPACSRRAWRSTPRPTRARCTPSPGARPQARRRHRPSTSSCPARCTRSRCTSIPARLAREGLSRASRPPRTRYRDSDERRALPGLPLHLPRADGRVQRRLRQGHRAHPACAA